ncbi:hypothetical protein SEA_ALLEB_61 [Microbacterium phage Alleb]|nr:hypothetical protein SEA_ALLEB_61 [Microbacterium phage Alleb]
MSITNFIPGDIVKIGSGFVDWEVVGKKPDGRIILSSGMTGRRCVVKPEHLKVWKADA